MSNDSDTEGAPSCYGYDTGSESRESEGMLTPRIKKSFKPSNKKKIQLTFENLTVKTIPRRKQILFCDYGEYSKPKVILNNVSGTFVPGTFTAILGSSGSGKTSFLNFLSGRIVGLGRTLKMMGKITINGKERQKLPGAESLSCYVQQDDILFQTMTVRECLTFAAKLKL